MTPTQKLIEAAEAAVEALTNCASEHGHRCNRCDSEVDEGGRVANALRTALQGLREAGEPVAFTPPMIEAVYAAWHGAGVDIAGGNWRRFVGMLPVSSSAAAPPSPAAGAAGGSAVGVERA